MFSFKAVSASESSPCGSGREKSRLRPDPDPRKVEPIRIPAGADGRIVADEPVRVAVTGRGQLPELPLHERQKAGQLTRKCASPPAMTGVAPVVHAHRVVEEREEAHDPGVGTVRRTGERDTVLAHALPVRKAMEGRGVRGRTGEDGLENVRGPRHRVSLDPRLGASAG